MSKNQWEGEGNLTKDAELTHTQTGKTVLKFRIACNERYQDKESGEWKDGETYYQDVEFWGKKAEVVAGYLPKGKEVRVEGKLKLDTWDDKETGQKRSKVVCNAFSVKPFEKVESPEKAPPRQQARQPARASAGLDDNAAGF